MIILPRSQRRQEELMSNSEKNIEVHQEVFSNAYKTMNNIIFIVSTGTLVLSVTFIGYIKISLVHPKILILSWSFLLFTVALNFTAQWISGKGARRFIELFNYQRKNNFPNEIDFDEEILEKDKKLKRIKGWAKGINAAVILSLVFGLFFLFFFAGINFLHQNDINKGKEVEKLPVAQTSNSSPVINNYYYGSKDTSK